MQDANQLSIHYRFIKVADKQLYVQELQHPERHVAHQRPTLVFLHEGLGCIPLWKGFPELLAAASGMNAVVYERQGYGQSDPLDLPRPKDYLEREALDFLPLLLQKLSIEKPILIGHSDGGSIALVYASRHPTHALITEAAHIFVEPVTLQGISEVKNSPQLDIIKQKLYKYHGEKTTDIFSAWADTWLREDFESWNIESYLAGIQCPTLIIQGADDEYASLLQVEKILEGMTNSPSKKAFIPGNCAHSPHLQAKAAVLDSMLVFLQQVLD